LRIAVLAGGESPERAISLESGDYAAAALAEAGHAVECFDPADTDLAAIPWCQFDACFIALHGGPGEDGRLQRRLDLLTIPYTGSGPAACRLAMSKSASKERFLQAGVPTPPYVLFHATDLTQLVAAKVDPLGYPLVVKPDSQGSSLGVVRVGEPAQLGAALAESRRYDPFVIAEPCIRGREFTVALLGRRPLPLLEIVAPGGIFDYEAKYASVTTEYGFETGLSDEKTSQLVDAALAAAESLGTRGLVRVDLMLDLQANPWVLEVNTAPALAPHSLVGRAAARASFDLVDLCDWMVRDALVGIGLASRHAA
jgi:D-alanine-D-alanine ligase